MRFGSYWFDQKLSPFLVRVSDFDLDLLHFDPGLRVISDETQFCASVDKVFRMEIPMSVEKSAAKACNAKAHANFVKRFSVIRSRKLQLRMVLLLGIGW